MTLDWHDCTANKAALDAYAGDLEIETSNMFTLLDRYFTGEHDETYLDKFAEAAPEYIERSLKALNIPDWDALRSQLKKAAALLSINDPDEAEHIESMLETEKENASNRAAILVTHVWPMLKETVKGDSQMAEMCGVAPEDWFKLDITSRSREYARAKKDGRLAPVVAQSSLAVPSDSTAMRGEFKGLVQRSRLGLANGFQSRRLSKLEMRKHDRTE